MRAGRIFIIITNSAIAFIYAQSYLHSPLILPEEGFAIFQGSLLNLFMDIQLEDSENVTNRNTTDVLMLPDYRF